MRDALKFLLLLSIVQLTVSAVSYRKGLAAAGGKKFTCPEGQYNYKDVGFCFKCTECSEFLYVKEKCSEYSNTVCGWCGKEPNYSEISDEVMASYQTKCLMSRLDFVDMSKLEKELLDEEKANAEDSGSIDDEEFIMWRHRQEMARDNMSDELEGRVPNEESEEKAENADSGDSDSDSDSESNSQPEEDNEEQSVKEKVHAYLIQRSEKLVKKVPLEPKNPMLDDDVTIVSKEEVEASLKQFIELIPVQRIVYNGEEMVDSSSEDSNERDIKWDRWVDDEVKPIREYVRREDVVEAEEIDDEELSQSIKLYAFNKQQKSIQDEVEVQFIAGRVPVSDRLRAAALIRCLMQITIFFVGMLIMFKIIMMIRAKRVERRHFQGVPIDCQDYHMIIDASRYVEELEKKEAKAARHIHENPAFDI